MLNVAMVCLVMLSGDGLNDVMLSVMTRKFYIYIENNRHIGDKGDPDTYTQILD